MNLQFVFRYKETHSQEGQFKAAKTRYLCCFIHHDNSSGVLSASSKCLCPPHPAMMSPKCPGSMWAVQTVLSSCRGEQVPPQSTHAQASAGVIRPQAVTCSIACAQLSDARRIIRPSVRLSRAFIWLLHNCIINKCLYKVNKDIVDCKDRKIMLSICRYLCLLPFFE